MQIKLDLHVHTCASGHAYSTLSENVISAKEKGLLGIALLDHGPALPGGAHEYYFSNLKVLPEYINGIRVFRGVEANIKNEKGEIDISRVSLELLDLVGISFHPDCGYEAQQIAKNTEVLLNAMGNTNVKMICHPSVPNFEVDLEAAVEAAKEKEILIEINNLSFDKSSFRVPSMSDNYKLLEICAEKGCYVCVNSDAHYHQYVGDVGLAEKAIKETNFPEDLIINSSLKNVEEFLYLT